MAPRFQLRQGCRLGLFQEAGLQNQAFYLLDTALDFFRVIGEMDVLDHGAALQRDRGTLHFEVLDQCDGITFAEDSAVAVLGIHLAYSFKYLNKNTGSL